MRIGIDARELCGHSTGVGRYLGGLLQQWMVDEQARRHEFVLYAHQPLAVSLDAHRFPSRIVAGRGGTRWEQQQLLSTLARDHVDVFGTDYPTPDGSCVRDYIHVSDLVDAHLKALERLIERPEENLVLNLGYGRGLSVLEVLDALDKVLGQPIRREMKGRRAGDPPLLISSNEALLETLDWNARYADIETILTHALDWERKLKSRNWA